MSETVAPPPGIRPGEFTIQQAGQQDYEGTRDTAARNYQRQFGALNDFLSKIDRVYGAQTGAVGGTTTKGFGQINDAQKALNAQSLGAANVANAQYETALTNTRALSSAALGEYDQGMARARTVLDNARKSITDTRSMLAGAKKAVYDTAAKGMAEFRNQTVQKQSSWMASFSTQMQQAKDKKAAELSAAGYRPEEIKAELAKMDWNAGVQQAGQLAAFANEEETRRGDLQLQYDTLTTNTENNIASLGTSLTQMETGLADTQGKLETSVAEGKANVRVNQANQENTLRDAAAKVEQWRTGVDQTTQLGAIDAGSRYLLAEEQYGALAGQLALTGYGEWANFQQGLEEAFVPYAPTLLQNLGLTIGLEDRAASWEGAGVGVFNAGLGVWQGEANAALGQIRNVNLAAVA